MLLMGGSIFYWLNIHVAPPTFHPILTRRQNLSSRSLSFRPCCDLSKHENFPFVKGRQAFYPISLEMFLMQIPPL